MVEDLEYFQQMYLNGARMLQREIVKSISILDYDGSMIYDAYPDQFMLRRLSAKLLEKMKKQKRHRNRKRGEWTGKSGGHLEVFWS